MTTCNWERFRILGEASSGHVLRRVASFFMHDDFDVRCAAYTASSSSCNLAFVEQLLLARRIRKGIERDIVSSNLSRLLEREPGMVFDPELMKDAEYETLVRRMHNQLSAQLNMKNAIYRGDRLSLSKLCAAIGRLACDREVYELSGTLAVEVGMFEAMTGAPCIGLFTEDVVANPISILTVLRDFTAKQTDKAISEGVRYFFGHIVTHPDAQF